MDTIPTAPTRPSKARKMSPSRSRRLPEFPEDFIAVILFLLPPDDPKSIFLASRVCRTWRRVLTDPVLCRRYREFHRIPPLLGFFAPGTTPTRFFPTTAFRPRCPQLRNLWMLDARHGRIIFTPHHDGGGFVIWNPMTGGIVRVPEPPLCHGIINYDVAVFCAADGCDHLGCQGGPSLVALAGVIRGDEDAAIACLYSTEAGAWSDTTSIEHGGDVDEIVMLSRVLVRNALYFVCQLSLTILRYDLVNRELSVIDRPEGHWSDMVLMRAEDGVLVCARVQEYWIHLWTRETGPNGIPAWVQGRAICLEPELPKFALENTPSVLGSTDGGGVIFLRTFHTLVTIELSSGKLNIVWECEDFWFEGVFPYMSFYTLDLASCMMPLP